MSNYIENNNSKESYQLQHSLIPTKQEVLIQYQEALDLLSLHYSQHSGIKLSKLDLIELSQMINELEVDYPVVIEHQDII